MAKRALVCGCNYPGTKASLRGCINDAMSIRGMLIEHFGFEPANITLMLDTDPSTPQPTGANIKVGCRCLIRWVVLDACKSSGIRGDFALEQALLLLTPTYYRQPCCIFKAFCLGSPEVQ